MRWDVIGLVLGWTIRLVAIPLAIIGLFSAYTSLIEIYSEEIIFYNLKQK